ncbi:MAG: hypothetical protein H0X71_05465 [Rubrobacter sp.]|nr:hypothetical protein [Rubrobacter sp.]
MRIPDRTGVVVGYRVWRVIPGKWQAPSESLHAQTCQRSWSLTGPTTAYCPPRVQGNPNKPLLKSGPCNESPGFDCACGLYARYEPIEEAYLLPYVVGSVLTWGRVIHHAERSFFRAEKALPVAFVRPHGGGGAFPGEAKDKLFRIAEQVGAGVVGSPEELRVYTEKEASKW